VATIAAFAFLAWLAFAAATAKIPVIVPAGVGTLSIAAFATYGFDKSAARAGRQRVPEGTLHLLDTLGGWPGGAFAQQWLRHKSSKRSFAVTYWVSVAINVAAAVLAFTGPGREGLQRVVELLR
jgi:uncharacterized membrane protein YsdA (DUF1294 family)